jgi:molybdate transport system ATP-binding protein
MLELRFKIRLPELTVAPDCTLPGTGCTALLGPSGCGKTTLASAVAGLRSPESGLIRVNGRTFYSSEEGINLPPQARGIGFVFQAHRLFVHMTVRENLFFGEKAGRRSGVSADELIEALGIGHLLDRMPQTLSGGESQRVALGRAILAAESLLIMDEPLASLDEARREELLGYFERIRTITSIPILYITHSAREADRLADTVLRMKAGRIADIEDRHHSQGEMKK